MILIKHTTPKMIIADEGKHIRDMNDTYVPEHSNENGEIIPEHLPHYSTVIFVPDSFTETDMNELYVEEVIE